jgi:hypothetical protein
MSSALKLSVAVVALVAAMASSAPAAVIHEPANGVAVQQSASLFFDWAWDTDEYWTDRIIFTQVADPNDPIWLGGEKPGKVRIGGQYGFGESNATVTFSPHSFAPGTWYWRLCNKTIYGEDDKCYVDAEVRSLVVTPGPACGDGMDNDLDGKVDWPSDPSCVLATGTTEGPLPQCADAVDNDGNGLVDLADGRCSAPADKLEGLEPLPTLTRTAARRYIRSALRQEYGSAYRHGSGKFIASCNRRSRTRVRCDDVSWFAGDVGWSGWTTIWYERDENDDVSWNYAFRIKQTNWYCVDRKRHGDPAYRAKRCSRVRRVT